MATRVTTSWRYRDAVPVEFDRSFEAVRSTFLDVFADHHSVSVQASIWIVGKAVLEAHPEVAEISMSLPNLHHWTVDLSPFGIANDREVYVSTTEPHGLIEATIRRTDAG
jgi:urate oxidase